jgi:hypothetical protein
MNPGPAVRGAEEQQVAGEQRVSVDHLVAGLPVLVAGHPGEREVAGRGGVVGRVRQAGAVELVRAFRGPLVRVAALIQRVLQRRDRPPVGAAPLLGAGQILRAEPAVCRALGGLCRGDLVGVVVLKLLQRSLLEPDVPVELVVPSREVGCPGCRRGLLGLRHRERGLGQCQLAGRGALGRGVAELDLGQLIEVLQSRAECPGR